VRKFDNIEFEKDVEVQNVPNPPATITLVAGDRAAAAHSWEHSLSAGLHKIPGSKVFLNVGDYYKKHTGREMPYFCAVVREDALAKHPPGTLQKINKTYADVFAWIHSHEAEFAEQAAKVKLEPDVLRTAMNSGRMRFQVRPMTETKNRDDVKFCADFLFESGGLEKKLDDGYFIG
jgi:ABC-type nitrate/sulfonate/bicarbonate transport system substrate-binding protein